MSPSLRAVLAVLGGISTAVAHDGLTAFLAGCESCSGANYARETTDLRVLLSGCFIRPLVQSALLRTTADTRKMHQVRHTMRAIKHVLTERYYAWQEASKLARSDPEVNLTGEGPVLIPSDFEVIRPSPAWPCHKLTSSWQDDVPLMEDAQTSAQDDKRLTV